MIRKLSDNAIYSIRSGFCITSLFDCVSELVYNSLDANAKRISIRVDKQTLSVRVEDDGNGILPKDLSVVGDLYFTSKPRNSNKDRFYGFRGESLHSIGMTSKMRVCSLHESLSCAYSVILKENGGADTTIIVPQKTELRKHGTIVSVLGLFSKTPVRRNIAMGNIDSAYDDIVDFLKSLSFVHENVLFSFFEESESSMIYKNRGSSTHTSLLLSMCRLLKSKTGWQLNRKDSELRTSIRGYIFKDPIGLPSCQYVFVNGRPIRKSEIQKYVNLRLQRLLKMSNPHLTVEHKTNGEHRYPAFAVIIECPYDLYEVVFEPGNCQIVFHEKEKIECIIEDAILKSMQLCDVANFKRSGVSGVKHLQKSCEAVSVASSDKTGRTVADLSAFKYSNTKKGTFAKVRSHMPLSSGGSRFNKRSFSEANMESPCSSSFVKLKAKRKTIFINKYNGHSFTRDAEQPHPGEVERGTRAHSLPGSPVGEQERNFFEGRDINSLVKKGLLSLCPRSAKSDNSIKVQRVASPRGRLGPREICRGIQIPVFFSKQDVTLLEVLGQVDLKFIACIARINDKNGNRNKSDGKSEHRILAILDQHAMDERIRLERFQSALMSSCPNRPEVEVRICDSSSVIVGVEAVDSNPSTTCIVYPALKIFVDSSCASVLRHFRDKLQQSFGFRLSFEEDQRKAFKSNLAELFKYKAGSGVTPFETLISVRAIPGCLLEPLLSDTNVLKCVLEDIARTCKGKVFCCSIPPSLSTLLNSRACHGAIRFGDYLPLKKCREMVSELAKCKLPFQCAHGRPSIVPLTGLEDEKEQNCETYSKINLSRFTYEILKKKQNDA
eukprot:Nk52_evm49s1671 gene=Nk52_evmTU49s1671